MRDAAATCCTSTQHRHLEKVSGAASTVGFLESTPVSWGVFEVYVTIAEKRFGPRELKSDLCEIAAPLRTSWLLWQTDRTFWWQHKLHDNVNVLPYSPFSPTFIVYSFFRRAASIYGFSPSQYLILCRFVNCICLWIFYWETGNQRPR